MMNVLVQRFFAQLDAVVVLPPKGQCGCQLASIETKGTFIEEIKAEQLEDENLKELKEKMANGKEQKTTLDAYGVLIFKGRIYVPIVDDLIVKLLAECDGS